MMQFWVASARPHGRRLFGSARAGGRAGDGWRCGGGGLRHDERPAGLRLVGCRIGPQFGRPAAEDVIRAEFASPSNLVPDRAAAPSTAAAAMPDRKSVV